MYSMKKYLLLFLCLTLGVAYAQDTLRNESFLFPACRSNKKFKRIVIKQIVYFILMYYI